MVYDSSRFVFFKLECQVRCTSTDVCIAAGVLCMLYKLTFLKALPFIKLLCMLEVPVYICSVLTTT